MTDRHAGYVVVLDKDTREDDAEYIINAISMIRGVQRVTPVDASFDHQIAYSRAKTELTVKILDALKEI